MSHISEKNDVNEINEINAYLFSLSKKVYEFDLWLMDRVDENPTDSERYKAFLSCRAKLDELLAEFAE